MIKLKYLLLEKNEKSVSDNDITIEVPADKTGTIIKGISQTDPWEYYYHDADGMWKTKKNTASKFLDMQKKLISVYGDDEGSKRYETAVSRLNVYLDNQSKAKQDGKQVIPVSIPDGQVELTNASPRKSVKTDTTDKMKEIWFSVSAKRHPKVYITGKTDDDKYLEIENPRKLHLHKTVYVLASEFELTSKYFAKYIGTKPRYDIYKLKLSESIVNEQPITTSTSTADYGDPFTLGDTDPYEYKQGKDGTWYTKLKTKQKWELMSDVAQNFKLALDRIKKGPRYPMKPGNGKKPKPSDGSNMEKWQRVVNTTNTDNTTTQKRINNITKKIPNDLIRFDKINSITLEPDKIGTAVPNAPYMVSIKFGNHPDSPDYSNKTFYIRKTDILKIERGQQYSVFVAKLNDDKYAEKFVAQVTDHIRENFKILAKTSDNQYYLVQIGTNNKYLIPQSDFDINGKFKSNTFSAYELK